MGERPSNAGRALTSRSCPRKWLVLGGLALAMLFFGGPACGGGSNAQSGPGVKYPEYVQSAAPQVQEAYTFAVEHPEVLAYIPCYCGCNEQGHTSNEECFVAERRSDGSIVFDQHGAA